MTGFEKLGIGPDKPPKLILDFCWNHEGSIGRVRQMLQALRDALTPEQYALVIPKFQAGRDLPWDRPMYRGIKKMCEGEFGLPFLCTAFDYKAVDMLDSLDVAAIKIGSAEAVDQKFCEYVLATGRDVIISTGGMQFDEVMVLSKALTGRPLFLYCLSRYPAMADELSLQAVSLDYYELDGEGVRVYEGYSSHWPGYIDAVFAFALGAQVVEKHYSLSPGVLDTAGTDHGVSIGVTQVADICKAAVAWDIMRGYTKSEETLEAERALLKPFRERFYAGNHNQADRNPGQDQVPGSDARRLDSELS